MSDDVRLGLVLGGAVLVLGALLWRYLHRRSRMHALLRQMEDADPQERGARPGSRSSTSGSPAPRDRCSPTSRRNRTTG